MRRVTLIAALLLTASGAGCVENMPEFKELLGAKKEVPAPPEPVYEPPLARAQANATSVLPGVPVRFTSEGSRDPQGLALAFSWTLGDGRAETGATVVHTYTTPGEYRVRLNVANEQGLSDEDTLTVQVLPPNGAPIAALAVRSADDAPTTSAELGDELTFDASGSSDPDGDALTIDWDFGDGATSHDARAKHAYERPGLHVVRLVVKDPQGASAEASRIVAVNATFAFAGEFELTTPERLAKTFPLAAGAAGLAVTLTFPGGGGLNDLEVVLKDADGQVVARSDGETEAGAQDAQTRALPLLTSEALRAHPAGEWTVEVVKESRTPVTFELTVRETF